MFQSFTLAEKKIGVRCTLSLGFSRLISSTRIDYDITVLTTYTVAGFSNVYENNHTPYHSLSLPHDYFCFLERHKHQSREIQEAPLGHVQGDNWPKHIIKIIMQNLYFIVLFHSFSFIL